MNSDMKNLYRLIKIYNNNKENERLYEEIENSCESIDYSRHFTEAYWDILTHIDESIDVDNLTAAAQDKYLSIQKSIYTHLKQVDYARFYNVTGGVTSALEFGYLAAEDSVARMPQSTPKNQESETFGEIYSAQVPKYSFLYLLIEDKQISCNDFIIEPSLITLKPDRLIKKLGISPNNKAALSVGTLACFSSLGKNLRVKLTHQL